MTEERAGRDAPRPIGPRAGGPTPDRLFTLAYEELRALAHHYMKGERKGHTLQPTALVHEAFLRLRRLDRIEWQGRTHFFASAATQMRYILVQHARAAKAQKRDHGRTVQLAPGIAAQDEAPIDILVLDDALEKLERHDPRMGRIAEMRLIAGMKVEEVAQALGISDRTVKRDWRFARAWLQRSLAVPPPVDDAGADQS